MRVELLELISSSPPVECNHMSKGMFYRTLQSLLYKNSKKEARNKTLLDNFVNFTPLDFPYHLLVQFFVAGLHFPWQSARPGMVGLHTARGMVGSGHAMPSTPLNLGGNCALIQELVTYL